MKYSFITLLVFSLQICALAEWSTPPGTPPPADADPNDYMPAWYITWEDIVNWNYAYLAAGVTSNDVVAWDTIVSNALTAAVSDGDASVTAAFGAADNALTTAFTDADAVIANAAVQKAGDLTQFAGISGSAGQYPAANGSGGLAWTDLPPGERPVNLLTEEMSKQVLFPLGIKFEANLGFVGSESNLYMIVDSVSYRLPRDYEVALLQSKASSLLSQASALEAAAARNENNISINAFLIQNYHAMTAGAFDSMVSDAFSDETGITATMNFTYKDSYNLYKVDAAASIDVSDTALHVWFDETSGTVVTDHSSHGVSITSSSDASSWSTPGKINNALTRTAPFATPGHAYLGCPDNIKNSTVGTICGWLKVLPDSHNMSTLCVVQQGYNSIAQPVFHAYTRDDLDTIDVAIGSGVISLRDGTPNPWSESGDGDWHHLAIVQDGTGIKFYYDSVLQNTPTYYSGAASTHWIGNNPLGNNYSHIILGAQRQDGYGSKTGANDDLRIYTRALSQPELDFIYASGLGRQDSILPGELVGGVYMISEPVTADEAPSSSKLIIYANTEDSSTINPADLNAFSSSDGGTTWDSMDVSYLSKLEDGVQILVGTNALTGGSTSMAYKIEPANSLLDTATRLSVHGANLLWK